MEVKCLICPQRRLEVAVAPNCSAGDGGKCAAHDWAGLTHSCLAWKTLFQLNLPSTLWRLRARGSAAAPKVRSLPLSPSLTFTGEQEKAVLAFCHSGGCSWPDVHNLPPVSSSRPIPIIHLSEPEMHWGWMWLRRLPSPRLPSCAALSAEFLNWPSLGLEVPVAV